MPTQTQSGVSFGNGVNGGASLVGDIGERPNVQAAMDKIDEIAGNIHIAHGANDIHLPVAGHTVGEVKLAVTEVLNVDPTSKIFVNGTEVDAAYVLKQTDRLEFMKESGSKGF